jgi:hypothetical protein
MTLDSAAPDSPSCRAARHVAFDSRPRGRSAATARAIVHLDFCRKDTEIYSHGDRKPTRILGTIAKTAPPVVAAESPPVARVATASPTVTDTTLPGKPESADVQPSPSKSGAAGPGDRPQSLLLRADEVIR